MPKSGCTSLPSGVFYPGGINLLGPGVALHMVGFLEEREQLIAHGVPEPDLRISERAQVVFPYHRLFDEYEEERLDKRSFGSTRAGIAPFYADKALKIGVQVANLSVGKRLRARLGAPLATENVLLERLEPA